MVLFNKTNIVHLRNETDCSPLQPNNDASRLGKHFQVTVRLYGIDSPISHGLVARAVVWNARGPRFNPSSLENVSALPDVGW